MLLAAGACSSSSSDRAAGDVASTTSTTASDGGAAEGAVASIPATGQGWDEEFVYIGIMTMKDGEQAAAASNSPLSPGDQDADAQAIVDALNGEGGLFGRQIKLVVHDNAVARALSDPDGVGQENCTDFTQDRPVIAVLALPAPADKHSLRACLAKAQTLQVSIGNAVWDDEIAERFAPYFYHAGFPSLSRLLPLFVDRLDEQEYFSGWDTDAGAPSATAAAKVGVLYGSDDTGRRQGDALAAAFDERGHATETFEFAGPSDFAAAVLRFKANGVTHVTGPVGDLAMAQFLMAAKSQRYHPRLGIHSYMVPGVAFPGIADATPEQLNGAVGVGWYEGFDVATAGEAAPGTEETWCLDALRAGGQTFDGGDSDRFARAVGLAICDGVRLPVRAAQAGGGLEPSAIRTGILNMAPDYTTAAAGFGTSGISEDHSGLPGAARDLRYDTSCECFAYTGRAYAL